MAITATNLTIGSGNGASSFTTASIAPTANNLVVIAVYSSPGSATAAIPTVTGASGTWQQIFTFIEASNVKRITMFRDLSASPGSGVLTIDWAGQTQTACTWTIDQFADVDTSGTHGSGAIVQGSTSTANYTSGTATGANITLSALGSANNAAYGYIRLNTVSSGEVVAGASFTGLDTGTSHGLGWHESEWALNQTVVNWTWASTNNNRMMGALEIKAASAAATITYIDNIGSDSNNALIARARLLQGYQAALSPTTRPVLVLNYQMAKTPSIEANLHVFDGIPLRADVIGKALLATTSPVQPRAPPPPFTGCELGLVNGTDTLGLSTHNPNDTLAATCTGVTPAIFYDLTQEEDTPRRRNYRSALESTTHPVPGLNYQMAKTPFTGLDLSLQEDLPRRRDYSRSLESTTHPSFCLVPTVSPTQTPSIWFANPDCTLPDWW